MSSHSSSCSRTLPEVGSPKASCTSRRQASKLTHSSADSKASAFVRYASNITLTAPYEHLLRFSSTAHASSTERSAPPSRRSWATETAGEESSRNTGARTSAGGGGASAMRSPASSSAPHAASALPPRHPAAPRASSLRCQRAAPPPSVAASMSIATDAWA
eukprot:scaffold26965_cov106-Isochrysis_galbana.AAC.3